jgi:general secretion pathway protein K
MGRQAQIGGGGQEGWALVSVLWLLSLLALLAGAIGSLSFDTALHERRALDVLGDDAALDAAIARTVDGLSRTDPKERWHADGDVHSFDLDGRTVTVTVQDQSGLIDLNAADTSLLGQLLRSVGVAADDAGRLSAVIADWRRHHDAVLAADSTDAEYDRIGAGYRPRHDAFRSIDELRLVIHMTPALFSRLRPALTVYSHRPAVDTETAPRIVLEAYYPDQPARVNDLLAQRTRTRSAFAQGGGPAGRVVGISVEIASRGTVRRREAVLLLTGDTVRPYLTYMWGGSPLLF